LGSQFYIFRKIEPNSQKFPSERKWVPHKVTKNGVKTVQLKEDPVV